MSLCNHCSLPPFTVLGLGAGPITDVLVGVAKSWDPLLCSSHLFRSYLPASVGVHHSHSHGPVIPETLSLLLFLCICFLLFTSIPSSLLLLPIRTNPLCKVRSKHTSSLLHVYLFNNWNFFFVLTLTQSQRFSSDCVGWFCSLSWTALLFWIGLFWTGSVMQEVQSIPQLRVCQC